MQMQIKNTVRLSVLEAVQKPLLHYIKMRCYSLMALALAAINNISAQVNNANTKPHKRINILFLMSDQHRGDWIGASGAGFVHTPNLDWLAEQGINFTRAYSSVPSSLPARTSLLTGMSPWKSGQIGYTDIPDYPHEGPAMFTAEGYRTHAVGKNHFTPMRHLHGYQTAELEEGWYTMIKGHEVCDYTNWFYSVLPHANLNETGLDYNDQRGGHWFPFADSLHPTYWTAERAIRFLENYKGEEPWFLKVSFQRPHAPLDPPKRWAMQFADAPVPMPSVGDWAKERYKGKTGSLLQNPDAFNGIFPDSEIVATRRSYIEALAFVDEQLGRVLQALKQRGELENTLILYTSDHGDMLGDEYMWRKCRPYEGSTRIPMIIRWPQSLALKAKRSQQSKDLVELRDVLPTFLDAAGIPKPENMDGMSMLDILRNKPWRSQLDLEHAQIYEPDNAWVALTDKRYKYIYYTLTGKEQLFDLKKDPGERHDLFLQTNAPAKLIKKWHQKMILHLKERGEEWVKNNELVVQPKPIYTGKNRPPIKKQ